MLRNMHGGNVQRCLFRGRLKLEVAHGEELSELVRMGCYDFVDENIHKFAKPLAYELKSFSKLAFYRLKGMAYSQDILAVMKSFGHRPITCEELLSLGAEYPRLQEQFPVVALGSTMRDPESGAILCPALTSNAVSPTSISEGRHVRIFCFDLPWSGSHRFPGTRV